MHTRIAPEYRANRWRMVSSLGVSLLSADEFVLVVLSGQDLERWLDDAAQQTSCQVQGTI